MLSQSDDVGIKKTLSPRDPFFARMARGILNYMRRDMTHPDGGLYSAEVADERWDSASPLKFRPHLHICLSLPVTHLKNRHQFATQTC